MLEKANLKASAQFAVSFGWIFPLPFSRSDRRLSVRLLNRSFEIGKKNQPICIATILTQKRRLDSVFLFVVKAEVYPRVNEREGERPVVASRCVTLNEKCVVFDIVQNIKECVCVCVFKKPEKIAMSSGNKTENPTGENVNNLNPLFSVRCLIHYTPLFFYGL